jgi:hypothetical protein
MGGPADLVNFSQLTDWVTSQDDQVKNYSGTAVYQNHVNLDRLPAKSKIYLSLGVVKDMAKVKVNGKEVGTVWTPPYKVDVSKVIKKGENTIEIEVVNTWVNRLIGDSKLPEEKRRTWSNVNNYTAQSKYQAAGLIGPVTLEAIEY